MQFVVVEGRRTWRKNSIQAIPQTKLHHGFAQQILVLSPFHCKIWAHCVTFFVPGVGFRCFECWFNNVHLIDWWHPTKRFKRTCNKWWAEGYEGQPSREFRPPCWLLEQPYIPFHSFEWHKIGFLATRNSDRPRTIRRVEDCSMLYEYLAFRPVDVQHFGCVAWFSVPEILGDKNGGPGRVFLDWGRYNPPQLQDYVERRWYQSSCDLAFRRCAITSPVPKWNSRVTVQSTERTIQINFFFRSPFGWP